MPYGTGSIDHSPEQETHRKRGASRVSSFRQSQYQAQKSAVTWSARLAHYFKHHWQCLSGSLLRQIKSPFTNFLTYGVIAIAMTLPAGLYIMVDNIKTMGMQWNEGIQISLFTKYRVTPQQAAKLAEKLRQNSIVSRIRVLQPDQALQEYKQLYPGSKTLALLEGQNPFPIVLIIKLKVGEGDLESAQAFADQLKVHDESDTVIMDKVMLKRLYKLVELGNRIILVLSVILAAGILLIVGNTVRLEILNRRDEIIIVKLIGAKDSYIRRPLLYSGLWYGLFGGVIACLITIASVMYLQAPIAELSELGNASFQLSFLDGKAILSLIALSAVLGWLGAWIASYRHLRLIQPV